MAAGSFSMPIDPSAPENQSRLPHQRLVERSIPGIENASPEQLIRADGVGACPLRDEGELRTGHGMRPPLPVRADGAGADLGLEIRSRVSAGRQPSSCSATKAARQ